uniref:CTD19 n=1 Tax=Heliconius melpomene TaxID=34740 RepID=A0A2H4RMS3_HELME|nr:CTD19 [Heliconius melpomene]
MQSLKNDSFLEYNPDTLQFLREQYNLDKPGEIQEAIDLLEEWIKKQPHFRKKDFPRDYLERTIIISEGSVERAKFKLDRICTYRTLYPNYFGVRDLRECESLKYLPNAFMRKLTKEHYRTYVFKNKAKIYPSGLVDSLYQFFFMQCEYIQAYDYCNGLVFILDFSEANIMETLKACNMSEMQKVIVIMKEGYGMRIKDVHLLSQSKAIDAIISLFKQVFSAKLAARVVVHKTLDSLHQYVPQEILPKDYGGNEKPLQELYSKCDFLDIINEGEFLEYIKEMNEATTNEEMRILTDENQVLGVPGTFRTLSVD